MTLWKQNLVRNFFLQVAMLAAAGAKGQREPFEDKDGHEWLARLQGAN